MQGHTHDQRPSQAPGPSAAAATRTLSSLRANKRKLHGEVMASVTEARSPPLLNLILMRENQLGHYPIVEHDPTPSVNGVHRGGTHFSHMNPNVYASLRSALTVGVSASASVASFSRSLATSMPSVSAQAIRSATSVA